MLYGVGSFVEGKGIRFCHSGSGIFCYHRGHRAFPEKHWKYQQAAHPSKCAKPMSCANCWSTRKRRELGKEQEAGAAYLARIDFFTTECVVVCTHYVGLRCVICLMDENVRPVES